MIHKNLIKKPTKNCKKIFAKKFFLLLIIISLKFWVGISFTFLDDVLTDENIGNLNDPSPFWKKILYGVILIIIIGGIVYYTYPDSNTNIVSGQPTKLEPVKDILIIPGVQITPEKTPDLPTLNDIISLDNYDNIIKESEEIIERLKYEEALEFYEEYYINPRPLPDFSLPDDYHLQPSSPLPEGTESCIKMYDNLPHVMVNKRHYVAREGYFRWIFGGD